MKFNVSYNHNLQKNFFDFASFLFNHRIFQCNLNITKYRCHLNNNFDTISIPYKDGQSLRKTFPVYFSKMNTKVFS